MSRRNWILSPLVAIALLPQGWSWRLCFCAHGPDSGETATPSCCSTEPAETTESARRSCCCGPAERPSQAPVLADPAHRCADGCEWIGVPKSAETLVTTKSAAELSKSFWIAPLVLPGLAVHAPVEIRGPAQLHRLRSPALLARTLPLLI